MSLQRELDGFRSAWAARVGPAIVETIRQDNEALAESGIIEKALKAGDMFPGLSLPDQLGKLLAGSEGHEHVYAAEKVLHAQGIHNFERFVDWYVPGFQK